MFDLRAGSSVASLYAHHLGVTAVQADDWKIVSGGGEGLVCVWEMRMGAKLWEMHNRSDRRSSETQTLIEYTCAVQHSSHLFSSFSLFHGSVSAHVLKA